MNFRSLEQRPEIAAGLGLWLTLALTALLYWQGLRGVFIFDDFVNLENLRQVSAAPGWDSMLEFILSGAAGPSRRPLSLATFALQAAYWPQPWFFKYANVMLHLLNGCLIAWVIVLIGRLADWPATQTRLLMGLCVFVWLLNPMQVSTVLYVVQRMVELAALFTLAGIVAYLHGRWLLVQQRAIAGFMYMSLGVGLCGIFAVFSKENGILLPLYILVLEITLLHNLSKPREWRIWSALFLYTPLLMLLAYIVFTWNSIVLTYASRDFTLEQRLLTEPRVLIEYLLNILLPRPGSLNLFHDDFPLSTNLLTPLSTLPALLGILGALGAALVLRMRYPVAAFGVLWFLAGHTLESTVFPLLIMFEHRNYLPMLGPLLATAYGVLILYQRMNKLALRRAVAATSLLWLAAFAAVTWAEAIMWGKPLHQILYWAEKQPLSRSVQIQAAVMLADLGNINEAHKYYMRLAERFPDETGWYVMWLNESCKHPLLAPPDLGHLLTHFQASHSDPSASMSIDSLVTSYFHGECEYLSVEIFDRILQVLLANPSLTDMDKGVIYINYARFMANQKRYRDAIELADHVLIEKTRFSILPNLPLLKILRLAWLTEDGQYQAALTYIAQLRNELNPLDRYRYTGHLEYMEHTLRMFELTYRKPANTDTESDPLRR